MAVSSRTIPAAFTLRLLSCAQGRAQGAAGVADVGEKCSEEAARGLSAQTPRLKRNKTNTRVGLQCPRRRRRANWEYPYKGPPNTSSNWEMLRKLGSAHDTAAPAAHLGVSFEAAG